MTDDIQVRRTLMTFRRILHIEVFTWSMATMWFATLSATAFVVYETRNIPLGLGVVLVSGVGPSVGHAVSFLQAMRRWQREYQELE